MLYLRYEGVTSNTGEAIDTMARRSDLELSHLTLEQQVIRRDTQAFAVWFRYATS